MIKVSNNRIEELVTNGVLNVNKDKNTSKVTFGSLKDTFGAELNVVTGKRNFFYSTFKNGKLRNVEISEEQNKFIVAFLYSKYYRDELSHFENARAIEASIKKVN